MKIVPRNAQSALQEEKGKINEVSICSNTFRSVYTSEAAREIKLLNFE